MYRHVAGSRTCETVAVAVPTVTVPVRASPLLAATLNATEPFPLPLAPDVIVIHAALPCAVHSQSLSVDTVIETFPPV